MNAKKVFNIIILLSIGVGLSVMVYMKRDNNAFTNIKNNRNESDCREFLEKFPDSEFVPQVKQILEEVQYEDNSLPNGSQPYREFYGSNKSYAYGRPSVKVNASNSSDVLVIVRYNNSKGKVAGHAYIQKGCSSTIYLLEDYTYQVFFYYGTGWYPNKKMSNGVVGGFLKDESFSKDGTPMTLDWGESMTYTLTRVVHGNFSTSSSSASEIF